MTIYALPYGIVSDANDDNAELHAFAKRIRVIPKRFAEDRLLPLYECTEAQLRAAIRAGAVEITGMEFVRLAHKVRKQRGEAS